MPIVAALLLAFLLSAARGDECRNGYRLAGLCYVSRRQLLARTLSNYDTSVGPQGVGIRPTVAIASHVLSIERVDDVRSRILVFVYLLLVSEAFRTYKCHTYLYKALCRNKSAVFNVKNIC